MKIIISPSKGMNINITENDSYNKPMFLDEANYLANIIKKLSIDELSSYFKINKKLAYEVYNYYQQFNNKIFPAIKLYDGVAYRALDYQSLDDDMKCYLNDRLLILSALYGILRPNDSISLYRLDFINNPFDFNLYKYWDIINNYFSKELIINLASKEYSKMLNKKIWLIFIFILR